MEFRNRTKSNLICMAKEAEGIIGRARGLMFAEKLESGKGLIMRFHYGNVVHSLFMRFAIDLVFLDSERRVIELYTLNPWGCYKPKAKCHWLIEVNRGVIEEKNIEIGDELELLK